MANDRELFIGRGHSFVTLLQWEHGFIPVWEYNRIVKHSSVKRWSMLTDLEWIDMTSGRIVDDSTGIVYDRLDEKVGDLFV